MELRNFSVVYGLSGKDKFSVIMEMVQILAKQQGLSNVDQIIRSVFRREKLASTAIGNNCVVPHAKDANVKHVCGLLGFVPEGVESESLDGSLGHIFFLIISPVDNTTDHLKTLSDVSFAIKKQEFRQMIMDSKSAEDMRTVLLEEIKTQLLERKSRLD